MAPDNKPLERVLNRLVHAVDADAALLLLTTQHADSFAFMLLDYNLPGQDGLSLLRELRLNPLMQRMPIVVFTTSVNPVDRDAFYAAGANAYHVKTVRYAACLQSLEDIFTYWLGPVSLPVPPSRLQ
jgi:two-component system, chemotaxis family, chemotaxis protein CheY